MIKYSFIIPVKEINDYVRESIAEILKIKRDDYEIIVYTDKTTEEIWDKTKQISSGPGGPAMKRSLSIRDAIGDVLIFIDDDSYPRVDFIDNLEKDFNDSCVAAVGGPAVTPASDSFWQKVSGAVFLSPLSGGFPERYAPVGKKKSVEDWPSVNFSIRKTVFTELNGFDSEFWPGEDTKLCLDLVKRYPNSIIYDPKLIVYHHRRTDLVKHLKQVSGYGLHRGFFAKKYPKTSFKLKYFIPSLFLLFVVFGGLTSLFGKVVLEIYLLGWIIYVLALIKAFFDIGRYEKNFLIVLNSIYYIFLTHLFYGYKFLRGLIFVRNLKSRLR